MSSSVQVALRLVTLVTLAALAMSLAPAPAAAQYFGRNKVKYRTFDFEVLKTAHFDVYHYKEEQAAAELAARMAERWYERLSRVLDHQLSSRQPLILYASHPHFEQTSAIPGEIGEGTGGVTEIMKRRIVLPLAGTLAETDHVIGHELVHAFQFDITRRGSSLSAPSAALLPLWFVEGMAEYLSIGPVDANTAMWLRDAARANKLPTVRQLGNPRYFPYRYGHALWAYVAGRFGEASVGQILKAATKAEDAERAMALVTGVGADTLSREWHAALRGWYGPIGTQTVAPSAVARRVIPGSEHTHYNVGPALSPDGRWLVFLSERDQLSVEMFLADATTGRVVRRLTRAALDPHLESLEFIQSAGSFSPDGKLFAFASIERGVPVLNLYDLDRQQVERKLRFKTLDEIVHPTWSPDGRRIAFAAQVGGVTDLFVVELDGEALRQLTNDSYAALEPAWSPDGSRIAFVTDAFTTDVADLAYKGYRIALIDPAGGTPTVVPGFEGARHVNPQWSPDGASLYVIADPQGISNLYRVTLGSGAITQITNLATGVSGITPLSPAVSAARSADRVAISVYENGSYHIDVIESAAALAGGPVNTSLAAASPAALPPVERAETRAASMFQPPSQGLPVVRSFQRDNYRARLSLDNISNVSAGVGVGNGSVAVGGGAVLTWSDMLGDHNLLTFLQFNDVGSSFSNNLAAGAGYWNERGRWTWGGQLTQIPFITREVVVDFGTVNGQPAVRQRDFRSFQIERDALGYVAYPFNRAQRVEFGAGFRFIDFKGEVEERIFDENTGVLIRESVTPIAEDSLPSVSLGLGSAALVYDNSRFGGTSPVLGHRYRLEVSPVIGDLQFTGLLGDYRHYLPLIRPLVLAGRAYHFGRYGGDAESNVLSDLFVGYPWLVRGYDSPSFTLEECETNDCPEFERLTGSRIAVGNVELRLPVLGPLGLIRSYGLPPIELAAFYDVGAAWRESEPSPFASGARDPVTSHGLTARINLFGIVVETNYVHPNDRPLKGWYWQINLQPGF